MYVVHQLSQFVHQPRQAHWCAALHIIKYLKFTTNVGLFFLANNPLVLEADYDADWDACGDTRHSITGFCIYLGSTLVSWKSKKQPTVSRSSAEAEYRSMAAIVSEIQWITYLLQDFHVPVQFPILLKSDSQATIYISRNSVFHEHTKHIELDCHIVQDKYKEGFISLLHVSSSDQVADIMTKALAPSVFHRLFSKLNLVQFSEVST